MAEAKTDNETRRQRAVMATDVEWERIGQAARAHDMDRSRYLIHKGLAAETLPPEVTRRAVREALVLSRLEEKRLREMGAGDAWEDTCNEVDSWMEQEGVLERLTDPGAANRWKEMAVPDNGKDGG